MLYNLQRAAYILARCPTCLHSPSIIIIVTRKRHEVTRTFDEKDLWNYVHVHDMYIRYRLDGAGWYYYPHVVCPVYVNTGRINRPCHHHEIYTYRYFYRIQYLIHHATSIAMTSYLLALAYIHTSISRCHSALEVESVHTCTSLCDNETEEPKDT